MKYHWTDYSVFYSVERRENNLTLPNLSNLFLLLKKLIGWVWLLIIYLLNLPIFKSEFERFKLLHT